MSARISPKPHERSLPNFSCMLPVAVARSSSGKVTKSQGKGVILEVFFPTDNALYSIAFGTHTKTAESIEMSFGMMSGLGPRNSVLREMTIAEGEWAILGENMRPTSLTLILVANWTGP